MLDGFTDYIFMTVDMADPTKPKEAGRYWLPGMNTAAGETPSWGENRRFGLHHAIVNGDTAYGAWRDGGLVMMDVSDRTKPKLIKHHNWSPPFGGGTHNCLPLPDRNLLVVADEAVLDNCEDGIKYTWMFDIREPTNPVSISTFPTPDEADYCKKGAHFGPHNIHENRPDTFVSSELIFCDLSERRHSGDGHQQCVPAEGGGGLRAAGAEAAGRRPPEPRQGHPVLRRPGHHGRHDLHHRLQWRHVHPGVSGVTAAPTHRVRKRGIARIKMAVIRISDHTVTAGERKMYAPPGVKTSKDFPIPDTMKAWVLGGPAN